MTPLALLSPDGEVRVAVAPAPAVDAPADAEIVAQVLQHADSFRKVRLFTQAVRTLLEKSAKQYASDPALALKMASDPLGAPPAGTGTTTSTLRCGLQSCARAPGHVI